MTQTTKAKPGRPRSEASRKAILDAAYRLVAARGYREVTAQQIAAAAGAGKQTLYRWWPNKAAVVLDALAETGRTRIDRPQAAAIAEGDLETFLTAVFAAVDQGRLVLRHLMAEAQFDPDLRRLLLERLIEPRREALRILATRIPDPSSREAAVAAIYGALWYRILLDEPLDDGFAAALTELLLPGDGNGRRP